MKHNKNLSDDVFSLNVRPRNNDIKCVVFAPSLCLVVVLLSHDDDDGCCECIIPPPTAAESIIILSQPPPDCSMMSCDALSVWYNIRCLGFCARDVSEC